MERARADRARAEKPQAYRPRVRFRYALAALGIASLALSGALTALAWPLADVARANAARAGAAEPGTTLAVLRVPTSAGISDAVAKPMPALPAPIDPSDFRPTDPVLADLGQLLFYDPILSGNQNISCGTCHNHDHASADGLSLPVGEGGMGLGPKREMGGGIGAAVRRVPRHSPVLFNLGHHSVRTLFHDGRLAVDPNEPSGFEHPLLEGRRHDLPAGLDGIVAAQAMFPVTSETEMRGHADENDVALNGARSTPEVWARIARRIGEIPEYVALFVAAFPDIEDRGDITYAHAANAIADFIETEWRSVDAPFDRWLAGEATALNAQEARGAALFFGEAGCAACHSGPLFSDGEHHAVAMPQIGPGRTRLFSDGAFDRGRMNVTNRREDAYRFRTPTLRNVAATAPYGHAGAYSKLESVVRHHLDPAAMLEAYDPDEAILARHDALAVTDFLAHEDARERARIAAVSELEARDLPPGAVADLVAFLGTLSDPIALEGRRGKPDRVPSGLPVD